MKLTEKIAYMKGLLDGMELDGSTKEGKAILQMAEVMEEMGVYIDDLQSQVDELTELCDLLDKDLGEVETDLYCDDDEDIEFDDDDDEDDDFALGEVLPADYDDFAYDDDDEDFDEVQYVVNCPSCDETVNLSERQLEEGSMICPHCGELLEFNYDNIEADFAADAEDEAEDDAESEEDEGDAE
jgi:formylmethanofuran dehydrogenase subunit E